MGSSAITPLRTAPFPSPSRPLAPPWPARLSPPLLAAVTLRLRLPQTARCMLGATAGKLNLAMVLLRTAKFPSPSPPLAPPWPARLSPPLLAAQITQLCSPPTALFILGGTMEMGSSATTQPRKVTFPSPSRPQAPQCQVKPSPPLLAARPILLRSPLMARSIPGASILTVSSATILLPKALFPSPSPPQAPQCQVKPSPLLPLGEVILLRSPPTALFILGA